MKKNKRNEKKKKSLRGVGGWMGRDEKENKNKIKRKLKCGGGGWEKINK